MSVKDQFFRARHAYLNFFLGLNLVYVLMIFKGLVAHALLREGENATGYERTLQRNINEKSTDFRDPE